MTVLDERWACRRRTAANWESTNEVLLNSEIGVVTDSGNPRAFKIGDGTTAWNSLPVESAQFAVASGTNTVTATFVPKPVLFDGALFHVRAAAANTGAATFNPNSLGALSITKQGGTALSASDIAAAGHEIILRYRASPARYELLNPATAGGGGGSTPTGTGFRHVAAGTEDAAAKLVDTADINNNQVTYAKMQDVSATSRILGRKTAGSGDPEECTLSQVLDFVGSAADGDMLIRSGGSWIRRGIGSTGQVLTVASGVPAWGAAGASSGGAMTKIGTATVGGSAVTSLSYDATGNPLSGFSYYRIRFSFKNATASAGTLSLYLNSDTTGGNYDRQTLSDIGGSVVGARTNANLLCTLLASAVVDGYVEIALDRNGKAIITVHAGEGENTVLQHRTGVIKYRTVADINFLTVTSSVANSLSPGDYFILYGVN